MSVPNPVMARLETQLEALSAILARATPNTIDQRPSSGDWSARENLAHLARHHAVFLDRLERLLVEDRPQLGRYVFMRCARRLAIVSCAPTSPSRGLTTIRTR